MLRERALQDFWLQWFESKANAKESSISTKGNAVWWRRWLDKQKVINDQPASHRQPQVMCSVKVVFWLAGVWTAFRDPRRSASPRCWTAAWHVHLLAKWSLLISHVFCSRWWVQNTGDWSSVGFCLGSKEGEPFPLTGSSGRGLIVPILESSHAGSGLYHSKRSCWA